MKCPQCQKKVKLSRHNNILTKGKNKLYFCGRCLIRFQVTTSGYVLGIIAAKGLKRERREQAEERKRA